MRACLSADLKMLNISSLDAARSMGSLAEAIICLA